MEKHEQKKNLTSSNDFNKSDLFTYSISGSIGSFQSASTGSLSFGTNLENEIGKHELIKLLRKLSGKMERVNNITETRLEHLETTVEYLIQRQNATDSYFIDEIDSIKKQLNGSDTLKLKSKIEEIQILLQENIDTLFEIQELEDNWNQYGAKKFDSSLIIKCIKFVNKLDLDYQPEIFPSAQNSIHFEFKPDEDHYLGIIFFIDRIKLYKRIGDTKIYKENISEAQALDEIKKFRQEFRNSQHRILI